MNKPKLNYINQDYTSILNELVDAMTNGTAGLTTRWNNISQADPMFLMLHLFAAHKDMENFMIDYRLNESFMSTARERASMVRIANSHGYKIPSYRAASALYQVGYFNVDGVGTGDDGIIKNWATFIDKITDRSYVYINDVNSDLGVDFGEEPIIRVFEGTKQVHTFSLSTIESETKTHIISNQSISIGSAHSSAKMLSRLVLGEGESMTVFTEVPNLLEYTGASLYVYELNVDPQGITYIKFHQNLSIESLNGSFTLTYLVTSGTQAVMGSTLITSDAIDVPTSSPATVEITLVSNTIINGKDPFTAAEIKSGFSNYIANSETLIRVEDVYNYIKNVQTINQSFTKMAVYSYDKAVVNGEVKDLGYTINFGAFPYYFAFVIMDAQNNLISASLLTADLESKVVVPFLVQANQEITVGAESYAAGKDNIQVSLTFNPAVSLSDPQFTLSLRTAVRNYLMTLNAGEEITQSGIREAIRIAGFAPIVYETTTVYFRRLGDASASTATSYTPKPNAAVNLEIAAMSTSIYLKNNGTSW